MGDGESEGLFGFVAGAEVGVGLRQRGGGNERDKKRCGPQPQEDAHPWGSNGHAGCVIAIAFLGPPVRNRRRALPKVRHPISPP